MSAPAPAIGIMLECQEGLTWESFLRLAGAVDELGFESLFRSDHLTALQGEPKRATLALWPALTALALRTKRLRFGPLVCSMTFREPALVARMAADVAELSGGRLELGIGAGWNANEHRMFGVPFPHYAVRLEMLDEAAQVIRALWAGGPTSFAGRHYSLVEAESYPLPAPPPRLIMGGSGQRTLQLVARHATEWNCSYGSLALFKEKSAVLDEACRAIGRDPASLPRSCMLPYVVGRDGAAIQARINAQRATFPSLPADLAAWNAAGFIGGSPEQVTEQLGEWAEAGCRRLMLQHNDLSDVESLELLAAEVLPRLARMRPGAE